MAAYVMSHGNSSRYRFRQFCAAFRRRAIDGHEGPEVLATTRPTRRHQYVQWLRPYGRGVAGVLALSLAVAALDMLPPLFLKYIVDGVLSGPGKVTYGRLWRLHAAGGLFLVVLAGSQILDAWRMLAQRLLNVRMTLALRRSLHARLLHLPLHELAQMKSGGVVSRLSSDVDATTGLVQMALVSPGVSLVRIVLALAILWAVNWRLAAAAGAVIPGILTASLVMACRVRPIYRAIREDGGRIDARTAEAFSGIRAVRAFGGEVRERLAFAGTHHLMARKELLAHAYETLLWSVWSLVLGGASLAIVWLGGWLKLRGQATLGDLMAFQWYMLMLIHPVWRIVESMSQLQRGLAAAERVMDVLALKMDKPDAPDAVEAPPEIGRIELEDVWFTYPNGTPALRGVSFTVRGGSVVALVGRSGAGKTTLTDLVARFHDPTQGRVLANGVDLRRMRLKSYRALVALVQQDVFLFDGSIRENIAYGKPNAEDTEIAEAARRAHAHDFILRLPRGYDTLVGERGVRLSGGERQRLAIARALLADPKILILDEATSNLDSDSERAIQASLAELFQDRTTFVIAHRLSTVVHADLIVVLDQGRVVEQGTHKQLIAAAGVYRRMIDGQHLALDHLGVDLGMRRPVS